MAIVVTDSTPVTKSTRVPSAAFLEAAKNRVRKPSQASIILDEVVATLKGLAPIVDGVGPSAIFTDKAAKVIAKAAKIAGLTVIVRNSTDGGRQAWVK